MTPPPSEPASRQRAVKLDARCSPADLIERELLELKTAWLPGSPPDERKAEDYDGALRWLTVTDQKVAGELGRALLEVKRRRLHEHEGHARWSTYVRAFVGRTQRWTQYEMRRERELTRFPMLAEAFRSGELGKSHLRVALGLVTPDTENQWLARCRTMTVRELEEAARKARADQEVPSPDPGEEPEVAQALRHLVSAPPGVVLLVGEAVELARRVAGYQIGVGEAVGLMAAETLSAIPCGEALLENGQLDGEASVVTAPGNPRAGSRPARPTDDSHSALVEELGRGWSEAHRWMEESSGRWARLPWDLPHVIFEAAPSPDAPAHQRVMFWAGVQGRLDAVRGRLLRIVEDSLLTQHLDFASLGQYTRERLGMSLREAQELIDLDHALSDLPAAFRMYAAGRLSRSAAWVVARVATTSRGDRAWTRCALTHSLRWLEAAVEAAQARAVANPGAWRPDGILPPGDASFAALTRMCSHPARGRALPCLARVRLLLDEPAFACYRQALAALRDRYGHDRPEWWCLAVMARHFIDEYANADDEVRRTLARKVIQRDNYTCTAPECLQRGGLEADHVRLRSAGGSDSMDNQASLCGAHHRRIKHEVGSLILYGRAPDDLTVRMGGRAYLNDRLVGNEVTEQDLGADPWAVRETPAAYAVA